MKLVLATAMAMALMGTACSKKGTEGVSSDGTCTQTTIDTYNSINENTRSYLNTGNKKDLEKAAAQCARFNSLLGADSCKASNKATGAETTITKASAEKVCNVVNATLGIGQKPIPAPQSNENICSQEVLNSIDGISENISKYAQTKRASYLNAASEACENFEKEMDGKPCAATVQGTQEVKTIQPSTFKKLCKSVSDEMNDGGKSPKANTGKGKRVKKISDFETTSSDDFGGGEFRTIDSF